MSPKRFLTVLAVALSLHAGYAQTPTLAFSRALGTNGLTQALALARDTNSNIYVTGNTTATNLATPGAFQAAPSGFPSAFVAEVDANGNLVFFTYLGGTGAQSAQGIVVDPSGDIFVTGDTSSTNFPTLHPLQATNGGKYDAFVTELAPGGSNLIFSTYLGGTDIDSGNAISLDTNGSPILTGYTQSTNFPTFNAFQPTNAGNGDAFVTKLAPNGGALLYSTFLGGTNYENNPGFVISSQTALIPATGGALAVAFDGSVYLTGWTSSKNFPVTNAFQPTNIFYYSGATAAYITKLDANGNLVFSSYFGGQIADYGYSIGLDFSNDVYVAGACVSGDLPVTNAFQSGFLGSRSGFLAAFDPTGTNLLYCTYLDGNGAQQGNGLSVSPDGWVAVTGSTTAPDFPVLNAAQSNGPPGFFSTENGGAAWNDTTRAPSGSGIKALATDPFNPSTLYAIANGLFRSPDRGQHWTLINNAILGGNTYLQPLLAFDPTQPGVLYYGAYLGVYKTVDGGNNWTLLPNSPGSVTSLAVDPGHPSTVYAGTSFSGVYKTANGGTNWTSMNTGLNNTAIRALVVDPANSSNVMAGLDNDFNVALYRSTNGGTNWTAVSGVPSYASPVYALAANPSAPSYMYAIFGNFFESASLLVSTNGGVSWSTALQMLSGQMTSLAVAPPARPVLSLAATGSTNMLSWSASFTNYTLQTASNLGASIAWQNVSPNPGSNNGFYTLALSNNAAEGFYRLASTGNVPAQPYVYVGGDQASLQGLLGSPDGGQTWLMLGLDGDTVNAIAPNPANPGELNVGAADADAFISVFDPSGGLYSSTFAGGSGLDIGNGVALAGGDVYFAGFTASPDLPSPAHSSVKPQYVVGPITPITPPPKPGGPTQEEVAQLFIGGLFSLGPCPKNLTNTAHFNLDSRGGAYTGTATFANQGLGARLVSTSGSLPPGVELLTFTWSGGTCESILGTIPTAGTFTYTMYFHQEPDCDWTSTLIVVVSPYQGP